MLDDGTYEVVVVDAEARDDDRQAVSVDLTVVAGPAKGQVVSVVAQELTGDPLDLLGLPATLVVADGTPSLRLEPGAGDPP